MIAQEYTCLFATISNSISAYNQIEQREFVICQMIMTHIWQQRYDRNILVSRKALKRQYPDFNCRMYVWEETCYINWNSYPAPFSKIDW